MEPKILAGIDNVIYEVEFDEKSNHLSNKELGLCIFSPHSFRVS